MDAAFLARIADTPDDDLARLVYADWLDEHGRADDAERIRLAVQLDPNRDRFDDPAVNALRERVEALTPAVAELPPGVEVEWRRGLPDTLCVPAPAFVEHGAALRERFPTARRLVLFRLNGWGNRVAACEALRGVRDLELACWYADADAEALAGSPHVADVERLTLWGGANAEQTAAAFVTSETVHELREFFLVRAFGGNEDWNGYVMSIGVGVTAEFRDLDQELLPFAPDFHGDGLLIGRMPDRTQVFAVDDPAQPAAFGLRFCAAGRLLSTFRLGYPPGLGRAARRAFAAANGFTPAFIRVDPFRLSGDDNPFGPAVVAERFPPEVEERWGGVDDPADADAGGAGARVYRAVRDGEFTVLCGGAELWCDRTGRAHRDDP